MKEGKNGGLVRHSVDKMSFVADPKDSGAVDALERYLQEEIMATRQLTKSHDPYRYMYILPMKLGTVSIADNNAKVGKRLRLEFNPNRATSDEIRQMYINIIATMKYPELTRIDLAFDYAENLSDVRWIDKKGRPSSQYRNGKCVLETYYAGGSRSKLRVVMYDKKAERASKQGIDPEELGERDWWRIELRFKENEIDKLFSDDGYNPFDELTPYIPMALGLQSLKWKDRCVVMALMAEEGESIFGEMDAKSRAKYKNLLCEYTMPTPVDIGFDFEQQKNDLLEQVVSWFKYAGKGVF
ncbi:hypothetical protein [Exiguobacterium alkaliphilum]|uniref:hypothetical protein n=2 Tax=Exiguobacterium alkaliphilum TaxID=1428684 RepID=UPI00403AD359